MFFPFSFPMNFDLAVFAFVLYGLVVLFCLYFLRNKRNVPCNETRNTKKKKHSGSKLELEVKQAIVDIFGHAYSFTKVRPSFLMNPSTKRNLEIDFFCKELRLAIEVNGRQHYEMTPFFHKDSESFDRQLERDSTKARLLKENDISLIVVPYDRAGHAREHIIACIRKIGPINPIVYNLSL